MNTDSFGVWLIVIEGSRSTLRNPSFGRIDLIKPVFTETVSPSAVHVSSNKRDILRKIDFSDAMWAIKMPKFTKVTCHKPQNNQITLSMLPVFTPLPKTATTAASPLKSKFLSVTLTCPQVHPNVHRKLAANDGTALPVYLINT